MFKRKCLFKHNFYDYFHLFYNRLIWRFIVGEWETSMKNNCSILLFSCIYAYKTGCRFPKTSIWWVLTTFIKTWSKYNTIKHHVHIRLIFGSQLIAQTLPFFASYNNRPKSIDRHFETRSILLTTLIAKLSSYHIIAQ